ncbi:lipocalin-like domain-containing protein [Pseudorhodoferax sp. Leaf274]|uniref:lipocalin-like domain-containing protein n=1 Tax=Pseudorhodoferax sp. Leaf274 TaxID=1736318 RepID=UPI000702C47B|nr:carotenoid 1,2-hydratase [Pseudorhodoferax sp. Leaf274]KQP45553.1 hydrolase [Pseudorhodoferax sp. Leaf274]
MHRRTLLLAALAAAQSAQPAHALPPLALQFPRDLGSHPGLRTEWWYITGQAASGGRVFGFQLTFFRSRVDAAQPLRSRFAARQLLFAHAAITDLDGRKLWHDQRIARAGFGIAEASETDTGVRLQDWQLARAPDGALTAELPAQDFGLHLRFAETQPLLLQGREGLSRKGPDPAQASYYYSVPQLAVTGALVLQGRRFAIDAQPAPDPALRSRAWLDHEWSEALMHPEAVGWDWIGMNLFDGSALTAFHLRRADGTGLWDGGSFRAAGQPARVFGQGEVVFTPRRWWTSPDSRARYPVEWQVGTPGGNFTVRALLDAQELDSRGSTGAIYWEGLSDLLDAQGQQVGRGYLEMTGYAQRLRL